MCLCLCVTKKPFIWSKLHNFGDTNGMRGDLNHLNEAFPYQALEAQSSIIGIGATPEGATSTIEHFITVCFTVITNLKYGYLLPFFKNYLSLRN